MEFIIDTNVLLDYPKVLCNKQSVISIRVLEELDGLKKSIDIEVAKKAQRASHTILANYKSIHFITDTKRSLIVDDEIVYFAEKKKYGVISNDINVLVKCKMRGVVCEQYHVEEKTYTGINILEPVFDEEMNNNSIEKIMTERAPLKGMKENEFLIIHDKVSKQDLHILRNKKNQLESVSQSYIENKWTGKTVPRNAGQTCLLNLLEDKDISILLATGTFGTGKSLFLVNYALQELHKGNISKIIWVPNNAFNENTRDLGALPGNMFEKELPFLGTLIDNIGEIGAIELLENNLLEVVPMGVMRGRNFENAIVIANEAQNLTEEQMKLLIGRCAQGSRLFLDGDIKQTDGPVFRSKNGLKLVLNLADSKVFSRIFGTVTLSKIERSLTAQASDYLDKI